METELSSSSAATPASHAPGGMESFSQTLSRCGLKLVRGETTTLQINVGLLCNQSCRHCHLEASPGSRKIMDRDTAEQVVAYARRCRFETIDITGGAPEMNPNIDYLIRECSRISPRVMLRSNLSVISGHGQDELIDLLRAHQVVVIASFPSINEAQTNSQRGDGIFQASITALQKLNAVGYGTEGSGLELNIVSNPVGAFLPPNQSQMERHFRQTLEKKWGIVFSHLFNFANVPLGRFRRWLIRSGNLDTYMRKLSSGFNPCAVESVMCRTLVSVSWDGFLYDCDFNLGSEMVMGGKKIHVSEMPAPPAPGSPISVSDHCYTCTAGSGFT
jgi:radical SAM/Cys-rich protein